MTVEELASNLETRAVLVFRDGRHYVPLFVPGAGSEINEMELIIKALRLYSNWAAASVDGGL